MMVIIIIGLLEEPQVFLSILMKIDLGDTNLLNVLLILFEEFNGGLLVEDDC
jgi:hypothetical protein